MYTCETIIIIIANTYTLIIIINTIEFENQRCKMTSVHIEYVIVMKFHQALTYLPARE